MEHGMQRNAPNSLPELAQDLQIIARRLSDRRRLLQLLSGSVVATLISSAADACIVNPEETAGPFPGDGSNHKRGKVVDALAQTGIVRSDITHSFGASAASAEGLPLTLTLTLERAGNGCGPLVGLAVYLWHCNRNGQYSLYSSGIEDQNYLRGVQVTDARGQVRFTSIYPGCYSGRYPHIHIEVYKSLADAIGRGSLLLTTQLAMPRDVCQSIYSSAGGYEASVAQLAATSTAADDVFSDSTAAELAAQTPQLSGTVPGGYSGSATIGIRV